MPRDFWRRKTCGKKIYYSDGYERRDSLQPKRLISIRRHYKAKHPDRFKMFFTIAPMKKRRKQRRMRKVVRTKKRRRRRRRESIFL